MLKRSWVDKDLANLQVVRALFVDTDAGTTFCASLGEYHTRADRVIGFGGRRPELAKYGGYTTAWITLAVFADRIAMA
jgi:hypothetical protein